MDVGKAPPWEKLAAAGVARISQGPAPYIQAMKKLEELAQRARTHQLKAADALPICVTRASIRMTMRHV